MGQEKAEWRILSKSEAETQDAYDCKTRSDPDQKWENFRHSTEDPVLACYACW